jgi:hypothetical protein
MIDNMLIARAASCDVRARLYANGHDLRDSTALAGLWRPARLSAHIAVERHARSPAQQHGAHASQAAPGGRRVNAGSVEGQPHGAWYRDASAPESKDAFEEIARFLDKHLRKSGVRDRGPRMAIVGYQTIV